MNTSDRMILLMIRYVIWDALGALEVEKGTPPNSVSPRGSVDPRCRSQIITPYFLTLADQLLASMELSGSLDTQIKSHRIKSKSGVGQHRYVLIIVYTVVTAVA